MIKADLFRIIRNIHEREFNSLYVELAATFIEILSFQVNDVIA